MPAPATVVLGSASPRRLELLRLLVSPERIAVIPPRGPEAGFDGLDDWPSIEQRLREIVRAKCDDVIRQIAAGPLEPDPQASNPQGGSFLIAADTVVVVEADGRFAVLGQPPEDDSWPEVVRGWFRRHYFGRTHTVATCLRAGRPGEPFEEVVVRTQVAFAPNGEDWLETCIAAGEPRGKAGGYAIQGAGSLFVDRVAGSLSNVVGLPLREMHRILSDRGLL